MKCVKCGTITEVRGLVLCGLCVADRNALYLRAQIGLMSRLAALGCAEAATRRVEYLAELQEANNESL